MIKKFFDRYFLMSNSERNGLILLFFLLCVFLFFRILLQEFSPDQKIETEVVTQKLAELESERELLIGKRYPKNKRQEIKPQTEPIGKVRFEEPRSREHGKKRDDSVCFFSFDPNSITFDELKRLGVSDYVARNIQKYRESGGIFYRPSDLKKIYGFDSILYEKLEPYITVIEQKKSSPSKMVELNSADTLDLMTLNGIGPVFARRIVKYRNSLGGFYSLKQVCEVFQFPEETYLRILNQIWIDSSLVKKIGLNFVSYDDLRRHPYIQAKLARKIVQYRARNGAFSSPMQLLADSVLSEEQFQKVAPYLKVGNN